MSGWNELGAMLGGGDGVQRERLREAGMEAGVRQADLLEQARQRRDQSLGMAGVTSQAITNVVSGKDPITGQAFEPDALSALQGELLSSMFHGKIDPRELSGYQKDEQGIGWGNQAMAAATAPNADLNLLNRMNLVRNGKPVDLSSVQGDTLINRMVTPDQQAVYGGNTPTQIGQADIALKGAQAGAANAAAGEHTANARLADTKTASGGFAPDHGATKPSLPPISILGAMLGQGYDKSTGLVTIPPEKMQQFLAWQAQKAATDPRYNNGDFAAQHYASEAPLGSGVHDTPVDVGAEDIASMMTKPPAGKRPIAKEESTVAPKKQKAPTPGTSEDGFIFKGGDPSDRANWVKADVLREATQ